MSTEAPEISIAPLSLGGLSRHFGKSKSAIRYILITRQIQPTFVAGGGNLYGPEAIAFIAQAIEEIKARAAASGSGFPR